MQYPPLFFTTKQDRILKIQPMVDSIVSQWPRFKTHIVVPLNCYIPPFIHRSEINIIRMDCDTVMNKHLAFVDPEFSKEDRYLTVDDDVVYPKGSLKNLLDYSNQFENAIIAYRGISWKKNVDVHFHDDSKFITYPEDITEVDMWFGTWGSVIRKSLFRKDVTPFGSDANLHDEVWLAAHLKDGVKKLVIPSLNGIRPRDLEYGIINGLYPSAKKDNFHSLNLVLNKYIKEIKRTTP